MLVFLGCRSDEEKAIRQQVIDECTQIRTAEYYKKIVENSETIVIDSCEYFVYVDSYRMVMAHKGNCKFCAERNKK